MLRGGARRMVCSSTFCTARRARAAHGPGARRGVGAGQLHADHQAAAAQRRAASPATACKPALQRAAGFPGPLAKLFVFHHTERFVAHRSRQRIAAERAAVVSPGGTRPSRRAAPGTGKPGPCRRPAPCQAQRRRDAHRPPGTRARGRRVPVRSVSLVGDEEHVVAAAQVRACPQIARRRHDDAGLAPGWARPGMPRCGPMAAASASASPNGMFLNPPRYGP